MSFKLKIVHLCVHCMAQFRFWNTDMSNSWSDCLLEDMASVSFPTLWFIAGVIIITCHYSSRLTNLIGDRVVPLLATLFLLSYTKLLHTAMTALEFGVLRVYSDKHEMLVWYLDGNLAYYHHPHIYLFIVAVIALTLYLLFTFFLFFIQCWRKISHLRLLRWVNRFTPFYDAYFVPLKDKHHYWFGTLLLVRIELHHSLVCLFYSLL